MASVERMATLSSTISEKTKIITDYLASKGLEAASFDVNGLAEFPIPSEDNEPFEARLELAAATKELHDIALGPKEGLRYLAWDCVNSLSLQAMWDFNVAAHVPLEGSISYEDLATKVSEANNLSIPVLNLRRLIRHAITNRIFHEPVKNQVAHTRTSRLLLEDGPLRNWVGFMCNDLWLPIAHVVPAMKKWPGSEESTETGVNLAYEQDLPWFDFIQKDEAFRKRYNLAMQAHGGGEGFALSTVVEGYPWDKVGENGKGVIVDLGGNQGYVSIAIAEAFPNLSFIVQDTAGMRTAKTISKVPDHLADRVKLTTHDFFTPQTEVADVYFFRMIFHGFADKYCVQILKALVPVLKPGAKVVINDGALPEPLTAGYIEERSMRTMDLFMQVTVNAREREADDWAELFAKADARYKVKGVWKPERSRMWFIEAEWMG